MGQYTRRTNWLTFLIFASLLVHMAHSRRHRKPAIIRRLVTPPPATSIGSYEVLPSPIKKYSRDVFVYRQNELDIQDPNEYNAKYISLTKSGKKKVVHCDVKLNNSALFLGLDTRIKYEIRVTSKRAPGEHSSVFVPSESDRLEKPLWLTSVNTKGSPDYELSWDNAKYQNFNRSLPVNYYFTLFWCESEYNTPKQCTGYLNWMQFPISESAFNLTVFNPQKQHLFAISVNSENLISYDPKIGYQPRSVSSGMTWESCKIQKYKNFGKIENAWASEVGKTYIGYRWKFDCREGNDLIYEYKILHCPVVSEANPICIEKQEITRDKIKKEPKTIAFITKLRPSTTYKATIVLLTKFGTNLYSDPIFKTTHRRSKKAKKIHYK